MATAAELDHHIRALETFALRNNNSFTPKQFCADPATNIPRNEQSDALGKIAAGAARHGAYLLLINGGHRHLDSTWALQTGTALPPASAHLHSGSSAIIEKWQTKLTVQSS